ncbi:MAG: hypothetical protein ABI343_13210 [Burkholderiaceae bacterium]
MSTEPNAPTDFPIGRFAGHAAFAQRVRDALQWAARDGWHEIIFCDATFEHWPLQERVVVDALQAWARPGRRFVMIAHRYDTVQRSHARFVSWRKTWSHLIECRACRDVEATDFPSVLWSSAFAMRQLDLARNTGVATVEPDRRLQMREVLDELLRRSSPAFPASTLGL